MPETAKIMETATEIKKSASQMDGEKKR